MRSPLDFSEYLPARDVEERIIHIVTYVEKEAPRQDFEWRWREKNSAAICPSESKKKRTIVRWDGLPGVGAVDAAREACAD